MGRSAHPIFVAVLLGAAIGGCVAVDLLGRPCPCIGGYVCADDVCVPDPDLADGGARTDGADAGFSVEPVDCQEDDACDVSQRCDEAGTCVEIECPEDPSFDPDLCDDELPADNVQLIRVCDDGDSFPWELVEALGPANGACAGSPSAANLVGGDAQGTAGPVEGEFFTDLELDLDGVFAWDVFVPIECVDETGCQEPFVGTCSEEGDGCACTDIETELSVHDTFEPAGDGQWASGSGFWRTCLIDGVFLAREDSGDGLQGPVFVFH